MLPPVSGDTLSVSICHGDSLQLLNGTYVNSSGTYLNTYQNAGGMDSLVYVDLSVLPPITLSQNVAICPGDTFWFNSVQYSLNSGSYSNTYTAANGCDSIVQTHISFLPSSSDTISTFFCGAYTLPNGQVVTQTGFYTIHFSNVFGCDSNKVYDVEIANAVDLFVSMSICQGTTATIQGSNNIQVSSAGVYVDSVDVGNCLIFIYTTVSVRPSYFSSNTVHICPGTGYTLQNGTSVFSSGTYNVSFTTVGGCDSVFQTTVVVESIPQTTYTIDICSGGTLVLPSGNSVSAPGIFQDTLISALGCDSILEFHVTVRPLYIFQNTVTICVNDSVVLPGGTVVNQTGVYFDTLSTIFGCDSVIETSVQALSTLSGSANVQNCVGDTLILPSGNLAIGAGVYYDTLQSVGLCDSVVIYTITNFPIYPSILDSVNLCQGDTFYLYNGSFITNSMYLTQTIPSINGCDSSYTALVMFYPNSPTSQSFYLCFGDSVQLPSGGYAGSSGTYMDTLTNKWGCDSIISSHVTVGIPSSQQVSAGFCQGSSYTLPGGSIVNQAGIYTDSLLSLGGCDSVIITQLSEFPIYNIIDSAAYCVGYSYTLPNGLVVSTPGNYISNFQTSSGCDSLITTVLSVDSVEYVMVHNLLHVYAIAPQASFQWLDCATGFSIIPGETDSILTFTSPGSFAVQITQNGCVDTSGCFLSNISIAELGSNNILVYPNPSNGLYHVRMSQFFPEVRVLVSNAIGVVLHEEIYRNTDSFSLSLDAPAGIFLLQIHSHFSTQFIQIIKVD